VLAEMQVTGEAFPKVRPAEEPKAGVLAQLDKEGSR
jgi:hypothetical protein